MSDVLTATPTNPGRKWSDQWDKEQRQLAGHLVSKAIANGKIIPQPCQVCGAK